jgi:hypothetical protein
VKTIGAQRVVGDSMMKSFDNKIKEQKVVEGRVVRKDQ